MRQLADAIRLREDAGLAMHHGLGQVLVDQLHRVSGEDVRVGIGLAADVGLDGMGQAVDAGVGAQAQGFLQGQRVVDDRRGGQGGAPGPAGAVRGGGLAWSGSGSALPSRAMISAFVNEANGASLQLTRVGH